MKASNKEPLLGPFIGRIVTTEGIGIDGAIVTLPNDLPDAAGPWASLAIKPSPWKETRKPRRVPEGGRWTGGSCTQSHGDTKEVKRGQGFGLVIPLCVFVPWCEMLFLDFRSTCGIGRPMDGGVRIASTSRSDTGWQEASDHRLVR